ncbi:MAG TPA: hypothetical protein VE753_05235 [Gaiellaceae bacterium]|jgi:hypothetical protein|nr:hypothetical protein [Gaiellaceae bacterium]
MARRDLWVYPTVADRPDIVGDNVVGFDVEGSDKHVGTVSDATDEVGASFIVVDTGPKKVMVPAGLITRIDAGGGRVFLGLTKDQIEDAPELDEVRAREAAYREELGGYYSRFDFPTETPVDRPRGVVG